VHLDFTLLRSSLVALRQIDEKRELTSHAQALAARARASGELVEWYGRGRA